jgi:class 3 adenylate cyclase/CheY-like chemotaxis protein
MQNPPRILVVDDNDTNRDILMTRLGTHGYDLVQATDGDEAVEVTRKLLPDLILLDVMMPRLDGIEATKQIKADPCLPFTPVILVTAKSDIKDVVAGLEAGADEYLTKPVDQTSLVARVKSMLRVKELHDKIATQAADLAKWNKTLEQRVTDQLAQIERASRLKRFLAPQVAELILNEGNEHLLDSHRRDVTVVFGDLRGFTAFAEAAEPEEVMAVLREYHGSLGPLVHKYEGTIERFIGDGFLVLFNDPLPCADPSVRAIKMATEMRACMAQLAEGWRKHGHELGFGIGIAHGYATLGRLGYEGRFEYSAIGTVVNLAARLCAQAEAGQILIDPKVHAAVEALAEVEPAGELTLKGLSRPIKAFKIGALRPGYV